MGPFESAGCSGWVLWEVISVKAVSVQVGDYLRHLSVYRGMKRFASSFFDISICRVYSLKLAVVVVAVDSVVTGVDVAVVSSVTDVLLATGSEVTAGASAAV